MRPHTLLLVPDVSKLVLLKYIVVPFQFRAGDCTQSSNVVFEYLRNRRPLRACTVSPVRVHTVTAASRDFGRQSEVGPNIQCLKDSFMHAPHH